MAKLKYVHRVGNPEHESCFLIGTVNITAGIIRSPEAVYIGNRVISANRTTQIIEPFPWVNDALHLFPDVMRRVTRMNVSQTPTWDNIDGYIESLIRMSYMASWGALFEDLNTKPLTLTAHERVRRLKAVVPHLRVNLWFIAQLLITVSALLLWYLQRKSQRPIVIDTGAAALMTDVKPVLEKCNDYEELSKLSYVKASDCHGKKLQLVQHRYTIGKGFLGDDTHETFEIVAEGGSIRE